jgi:ribosome-binding protein aMBF1 (putative translation factor)
MGYIAATRFMNCIETLTTKLGISIRTLASFLRIHHSLLARFDTAEKMLPRISLSEVIEICGLAIKVQPAANPQSNEQQKRNCNKRRSGATPKYRS